MCAEAGNGHSTGTVDGISVVNGDTTASDKGWNVTVALGSIAFAYSYSYILLEMTVRKTLLCGRRPALPRQHDTVLGREPAAGCG